MAKLSVIIPIYNVEKYLRQCLDSVINQTFRDLEIILVDDGSPDKCGEICDEYASKDMRIKVIHKENEGLPSARNDAIDIATGEWIAFVDSDDWLELDIYEKAISAGNKFNVDILFFNSFRNTESKETEVSLFEKEFFSTDREYIKSLQAGTICKFLTPMRWIYGYPWDRIIKRKFIMDNSLYFTRIKAHEDNLYAISCLQYAERIGFIEARGYHYRFNEMSIGNKYNPERVAIDKAVFFEMIRLADEYHVDENFYRGLYAFIVSELAININRCMFNKQNKNSFLNKLRYAALTLKEEPYYTAFSKVDRSLLTKAGRLITIIRHHNAILLYFCYLCKNVKGWIRHIK